MSLESDVFAVLNVPAVTDLIGGNRIYPEEAPQHCGVPYVVYSVVSTVPVQNLDGNDPKAQVRVQIDCIANKQDEATALDRAIRAVLRAAVGTLKNRWDDTRALPLDIGTRRYGRSSDYLVWHTE